MAAHHTNTVVSPLLLQRLDGAPAVVTRVVSGENGQKDQNSEVKNRTLKNAFSREKSCAQSIHTIN